MVREFGTEITFGKKFVDGQVKNGKAAFSVTVEGRTRSSLSH